MRNRALVVLCEGETLCEQWERLLEYEYPELVVVAKDVYDRAGYKRARGESSAYAVEDVWTLWG